jgi:hypothetical protein
MDIKQLKEYIIENNKIEEILEELGCVVSKNNDKEIRCSVTCDNNTTALKIDKENLNYKYYGDEKIIVHKYGDILILIQDLKEYSFLESINFLKNLLKLDNIQLEQSKKILPFGGFYHGVKTNTCQETEIPTYAESILNQFDNHSSYKFLQDGISLQTQKKFNIRYDIVSERILLTWRNYEGKIAGITGRYNAEDYEERGLPKYMPVIPSKNFKKSQLLYGYYENYSNMINNVCFIFEAEKSVLMLNSVGINNSVAVGSHNLSTKQIQLVQALFPINIILAYDKGIEEEHLIEECNRLKYKNSFIKTKIGYIWDDSDLLDDKESPIDKGKEIFQQLCEINIKWIN